ncbi:hypothetical protein V496_00052 [Pseudogymnoascus sp. VKM F-4515 (FW-2607)]|nr:hypothetical protein V496_00052 [Pseudogymnoascus sp. VKM F-4515 (FW-2607)]
MAPSRPALEDGPSQIISDVDFSEWLTEDCSTPGSPDSDDELFSQNTMHVISTRTDISYKTCSVAAAEQRKDPLKRYLGSA